MTEQKERTSLYIYQFPKITDVAEVSEFMNLSPERSSHINKTPLQVGLRQPLTSQNEQFAHPQRGSSLMEHSAMETCGENPKPTQVNFPT